MDCIKLKLNAFELNENHIQKVEPSKVKVYNLDQTGSVKSWNIWWILTSYTDIPSQDYLLDAWLRDFHIHFPGTWHRSTSRQSSLWVSPTYGLTSPTKQFMVLKCAPSWITAHPCANFELSSTFCYPYAYKDGLWATMDLVGSHISKTWVIP